MKVLFIQEIVPHYRVPFFAGLAARPGIELVVVSGAAREDEGFRTVAPGHAAFRWIPLPLRTVGRSGARLAVLSGLSGIVRAERPDVVVTTGGKRFIQNHALIAGRRLRRFRLFAFQHAREYRAMGAVRRVLEWVHFRRWIYPNVDGVILYTAREREALVARGLDPARLFFAQNTIDVAAIRRVERELTPPETDAVLADLGVARTPTILFLGRLVAGKGLDALVTAFGAVRALLPVAQLVVVGDGPLDAALRRTAAGRDGVVLTGAVYDERRIACLMSVARVVCIPRGAGLGVNHAFAYGRPFVTFASEEQGPEIGYVMPEVNGLILDGADVPGTTAALLSLLTDDERWSAMSRAARETADGLTMDAMVANVARALKRTAP